MAETLPSESGAVTIDGLTKRYDDVTAVDDVDLRIEPGELLVLLGPSGCGKTTTLRTIAGLERATSGTIRFGDEDVTRTVPQRRDVSMVFQSYALYPHETVQGNFAFPLRKMDLGDDERDRRIDQVARLLGIENLLDAKPAHLSGGQRQRVAVGRALVRRPHVLCMDEPLSNLDAKLRVETRAELRKLQQNLDLTTIYVTHDQEEAMSLADRIAVMNGGRIIQVGSPQEVYEAPTNRFVASFIGDPPMNFLETDEVNPAVFGVTPQAHWATIGVRPEDIYVADDKGEPLVENDYIDIEQPSDPLTFEVALIEPVGRAYEVTLEREGISLTARIRRLPDRVRTGSTASFVLDTAKVTAFDREGEVV